MSLTREQLIARLEKMDTMSHEEATAWLDNFFKQVAEHLYHPTYDVWLKNFLQVKSQLVLGNRLVVASNDPSFLSKFGLTSRFPAKPVTENQNQSDNSPKI